MNDLEKHLKETTQAVKAYNEALTEQADLAEKELALRESLLETTQEQTRLLEAMKEPIRAVTQTISDLIDQTPFIEEDEGFEVGHEALGIYISFFERVLKDGPFSAPKTLMAHARVKLAIIDQAYAGDCENLNRFFETPEAQARFEQLDMERLTKSYLFLNAVQSRLAEMIDKLENPGT